MTLINNWREKSLNSMIALLLLLSSPLKTYGMVDSETESDAVSTSTQTSIVLNLSAEHNIESSDFESSFSSPYLQALSLSMPHPQVASPQDEFVDPVTQLWAHRYIPPIQEFENISQRIRSQTLSKDQATFNKDDIKDIITYFDTWHIVEKSLRGEKSWTGKYDIEKLYRMALAYFDSHAVSEFPDNAILYMRLVESYGNACKFHGREHSSYKEEINQFSKRIGKISPAIERKNLRKLTHKKAVLYKHIAASFDEVLMMNQLIADKKVQAKDDKIDLAAKIAHGALQGALSLAPGASFASIGTSFLMHYLLEKRHADNSKHLADLLRNKEHKDKVVRQVSSKMANRYQRQLLFLTDKGIEALALTGTSLMVRAAFEREFNKEKLKLTHFFILGATNPLLKVWLTRSLEKETSYPEEWRAESILQKSGCIDGEVKYVNKRKKPKKGITYRKDRSFKYGFRQKLKGEERYLQMEPFDSQLHALRSRAYQAKAHDPSTKKEKIKFKLKSFFTKNNDLLAAPGEQASEKLVSLINGL